MIRSADTINGLRRELERLVGGEGLRPLSSRTGIPIGQIRSVIAGRSTRFRTVAAICEALDFDLVIAPRGGSPAGAGLQESRALSCDPASAEDPDLTLGRAFRRALEAEGWELRRRGPGSGGAEKRRAE